MVGFSREQLDQSTKSIYKLCNVAAMRAIELNAGMKQLVDRVLNEKVTITALREIAAGKVKMKPIKEVDEKES